MLTVLQISPIMSQLDKVEMQTNIGAFIGLWGERGPAGDMRVPHWLFMGQSCLKRMASRAASSLTSGAQYDDAVPVTVSG